jgi:hypothetical protein
MADLSSLMRIAPVSAAGMTGAGFESDMLNKQVERQRLSQLVHELSIKNQQSQVMNPLLAQEKGLQNQGLEAGLPGIAANSALAGTNATKAAGTLQTDIAAGNSKNQTSQVEDIGKQAATMATMIGKMGAALEAVPDEPGARATAWTQMLQQSGLSKVPGVAEFVQGFQKVPSSQLPQAIKKFTDNVLQQTSQFQGTKYTADKGYDSSTENNKRTNATLREVEQMRIDAGKYDKKKMASDFQGKVDELLNATKGDPAKMYAVLNRAAVLAHQAQLPDLAMSYQTQAAALQNQVQAATSAKANPQAGGVNTGALTDQAIPTNPQLSVAPPPLPGASQAQAPAPGQKSPQSLADVQKMYPGIPPEKLREAYKKKFGVDLK